MRLKLLAAASVLAASFNGYADTYKVSVVYQKPVTFLAGDDYGDYELEGPQINDSYCPLTGQCYLTYYASSNTYGVTAAPRTLFNDPNPPAGPGCQAVPTDFLGQSLCSNGHQLLVGSFTSNPVYPLQGIYVGVDPTDRIAVGYLQPAIFTPNGNLYFYSNYDDTLRVALDVTAAPTPEPSTFALLGTGLLGVAGAMKRRFA